VLLSQSRTTKARVSLFFRVEAQPRFCGLASVGRDPLWWALVGVGPRLPYVHLGHWVARAGMELTGGPAYLVGGEVERLGGSS
jgi:hypothetical protein